MKIFFSDQKEAKKMHRDSVNRHRKKLEDRSRMNPNFLQHDVMFTSFYTHY